MDTRETAVDAALQESDHGATNSRFEVIPAVRIGNHFGSEK
jgi:hypothetical protein